MSSTVEAPSRAPVRRGRVLARRPLMSYRTIDLVTAALLGVGFGVVFWAWDQLYAAPSAALGAVFAPLTGLLGGPWLLAGVAGGLMVRRPGAALFTELVAASVEALIGSGWGWTTLISGGLQGLGVELVLALFLWRRFGAGVAMLAGLASAAFEVVGYEWWSYFADYAWSWKLVYLASFGVSGALVAGLGGLFIVRGLARAGAVNAMPPGQEELERTAR
ncbi:MAG TPA: ECF transporter S component [Nocardioidaceae bacterium]|nr:ECF transporter S component [Nocardioidaceae bacterium]